MLEITSVLVAGLSLVISLVTVWLTMFRRGDVRMTQPAFVFFGPDGPDGGGRPKVTICTHLYATSDRGRIIESFYARLTRNGAPQDFDVWVYGTDGLHRGSGVYVGRDGVTTNHHFLLPKAEQDFTFVPGVYRVEFFAKLVGNLRPHCLFSVTLDLPDHAASLIADDNAGAFFEWRPEPQRYQLNLDQPHERAERELRRCAPPFVGTLLRQMSGRDTASSPDDLSRKSDAVGSQSLAR